MTVLQPINQLLKQLNVPAQDLAQLSFCDGSRESSVKAWVNSLPLTQIQFTSGLLYQALPDIGRFKTSASNRINLLETLRIPTTQAIEGLAQGFLNQPLILPDSAVKTATITQALQKHLINGYLVAVRDLCTEKSPNKELITLAIHRAITGMGLLLLRYYQLYLPISGQFWTELYSLYQIALQLKINDITVADELSHHQYCRTIDLAFTRTLLLASARPNQLRQDELLATYYALNDLSRLAQLQNAEETQHANLFAVALSSNRPPLYRSRFKSQNNKLLLELNTAQVCQRLQEESHSASVETPESTGLRNSLNLSAALTQHLIQAWNILAQRHFDRQKSSGSLDVTVGLTNIHYHLANGVSFTHFLNQVQGTQTAYGLGSLFQKRTLKLKDATTDDDPWGDAFDVSGTPLTGSTLPTANVEKAIREQEIQDYKEQHPIYKVSVIDTSPGGYCIEWRDEIPNQVKAGELLGLRDHARKRWAIGVVRWANHTKGATQLGIQILAPQATPVGLAIIHKSGDQSEYLRAFEIPALKAINQMETLITNAVSFREYSNVKIFRRTDDENVGTDENIQLTRRLFATGVFSQFTYRDINKEKTKETAPPEDFDSVWDS